MIQGLPYRSEELTAGLRTLNDVSNVEETTGATRKNTWGCGVQRVRFAGPN
jgi:hypothetical protein